MLKMFDKYNPRANPANTNYPNGSIKDRSVEGALDGTPLSSDWGNDMLGFSEALLAEAGVVPSGNPDTAVASDRMTAFRIAAMRVETAVSYTGGDTSLVGLVQSGEIAQEFEYVVHGPSLTRWKIGTVTGTFAGDFNPLTGVDSGLTGALVNKSITALEAGTDKTTTIYTVPTQRTLDVDYVFGGTSEGFISVSADANAIGSIMSIIVNGVTVRSLETRSASTDFSLSYPLSVGDIYRVVTSGGGITVTIWAEKHS